MHHKITLACTSFCRNTLQFDVSETYYMSLSRSPILYKDAKKKNLGKHFLNALLRTV